MRRDSSLECPLRIRCAGLLIALLTGASGAAAQVPTVAQVTQEAGCAIQEILGEGGELLAIHLVAGQPAHDDWAFELTAKGGQRIGLSAGDVAADTFQVLESAFLYRPYGQGVVFALVTFPDGRLYVDSGTLAFGFNWMDRAIAQRVGDSPMGVPGNAGIQLPDAALTYEVQLGAGPESFPQETADTISFAFAPIDEQGSHDVGGCSYGGEEPDVQTGGALIIGYNVYRLVDAGTVPTPAELGDLANFQYFATLDPAHDPLTGLHELIDPDGLPQSGDEVIVYHDGPTTLGGGPRPSGDAPARGTGLEYWYAVQPVIAGQISEWTNIEFVGRPPADRAHDLDGDGTDDAADADDDGSMEFLSPQADWGWPGLGLSSEGRPLLSRAARSAPTGSANDRDVDGVDDRVDNCPDVANPGQEDTDGDGRGDACDVCEGFPDDQDGDGDGVPDGCDPCPEGSNVVDSDGDGVVDGCDACPGFDDAADADGDGVADGCDLCPGFDDALDDDADTIPDDCDECPGGDDREDRDGDGVPDACDACPGFPDWIDGDGDGLPDACDPCPDGHSDDDADGDGVPDACDQCPGADDTLDSDLDTVPDCLDQCPGYEDFWDADFDGVPDGCDLCPGFDDALDDDGDLVPDGCDACPGFDDGLDADADSVPDGCDLCPGFDDALDDDGDLVPDDCDACPGADDLLDADGDDVPDGCDACPGFDDGLDADADSVPDGCDNCPADSNPGQEDVDGDGIGDACDCGAGPPGAGPGASLRLRGPDLSWDAVTDATSYPVHRGTIPLAGGLASRPEPYDHACLDRATGPSSRDAEPPPSGTAHYYLVGAANDCGNSIEGLGLGSLGAPRPEPDCP